jgi:hypothetical protein
MRVEEQKKNHRASLDRFIHPKGDERLKRKSLHGQQGWFDLASTLSAENTGKPEAAIGIHVTCQDGQERSYGFLWPFCDVIELEGTPTCRSFNLQRNPISRGYPHGELNLNRQRSNSSDAQESHKEFSGSPADAIHNELQIMVPHVESYQ